MIDVSLGIDDDLGITDGDFTIGESLSQDVGIILRLNQGDLKSDPILGPNLIQLIKSKVSQQELQTIIKLHLERDGKDYNEVKNIMQINTNTNG